MPKIITSNGVIRYKTHVLYCGVKYIDKEIAFENLKLFKKILSKNNIKFQLAYGTLLGAVREHDFISHDEDIDLVILEEEKQHTFDILPQLIAEGFEIARYDRRGLLSIIRKGEYIDLYFMKSDGKGIRTCSGILVIEKFLTNTAPISFKGEEFEVPKDYKGFLECEYGKSWSTPIEWHDFNMPKWRRWMFYLKEHLKDALPDSLYFRLASKSEKKLEAKCRKQIDKYLSDGGTLY